MTIGKSQLGYCSMLLILGTANFSMVAWGHPESFASDRPNVSRADKELQHRDLIRRNEQASRQRKPDAPRPLPKGVKFVPVETVKALLDSDTSKLEANNPKKLASSTLSINRSSCMTKVYSQVSWLFCVTDTGKKSLWVGPVFIKTTPTDNWRKLIALAGMAEIFVPYHGANFRPFDLQWISRLNTVGAAEAGPNGSFITLSSETSPTVVVENRDGGIGLLCHQNPNIIKRLEEFVVWGIADGGNYDNIIEYGFRDDGVMTFRMGNTGYGDPANQRDVHTHNGLWRVDIDVNGSANDSAMLQSHAEVQGSAADSLAAITYESGHELHSKKFTSLIVNDAATNSGGSKLAYEFLPIYTGNSRHFEPNELWSQKDIYVSKYNAGEMSWVADMGTSVQTIFELINGTNWADPDHYLLPQIANPEYVANSDVVVWMKTSFHHTPTDEENKVVAVPNSMGITSTHWSGFDLMPHNFFNANPQSPNTTCNHP
jgi:Copper amine oxidase, enzyme domain